MRLFLEITDGPDKGKQISLKKGASVDRKGADIMLNDAKLSGIHAYFKKTKDQQWFLVDNNSRNGVWVRGIREIEAHIQDGTEIQLGQTQILCRLIEQADSKAEDEFLSWLNKTAKKAKNVDRGLSEIKPEMRLKVIEGMQYGQTWEIFFGPRAAGKDHLDICLYDEKSPEEAFEILVRRRYPYFHTAYPDQVKINGESIKDKQLVPGDVIHVGDSKLLVEFDK